MREDDQVSFAVEVPDSGVTLRFKNFSYKTEFGWTFPELDPKKPVIIDSKWLAEYSDDIEGLRKEINKQRALSFGAPQQNNLTDERLKTEIKLQNSPCLGNLSHSDNAIESFYSTKKCSSNKRQDSIVKSVISNEINCNDSGFEEDLNIDCEETKASSYEYKMEAKHFMEEMRVSRIVPDTRCDTPQSEACYSILSCASGDSGVYGSDDVPEVPSERSLLEELEEIFNTGELTSEKCSAHMVESEETATLSDDETENRCPIWFQKFSGNCSLNMPLSSLARDFSTSRSEASAYSMNNKVRYEFTPSIQDTEGSEDSCFKELSDNRQQQQLVNLMTACDRLETLSLRGSSVGAVAEVTKLAKSFSKISHRLQDLRCGLQDLFSQAHENKNDFSNLEGRASHLLTSTLSSRRHLAQVYALQKLEDRLQEEWWTAYNPDTLPLHENYIV